MELIAILRAKEAALARDESDDNVIHLVNLVEVFGNAEEVVRT